MSCIYLRWT